jgi:hypothetical protein
MPTKRESKLTKKGNCLFYNQSGISNNCNISVEYFFFNDSVVSSE